MLGVWGVGLQRADKLRQRVMTVTGADTRQVTPDYQQSNCMPDSHVT